MKKMLFFINPNAGHSGIRTQLLPILETFCTNGYAVRVHTTSGPREITRMLTQEGENYDMVVASGGDGTLNETIAGLVQLQRPPVLGYIPAGTVNDVATSLGLSLNPLDAARDAVFGEETPLDAGRFNGRAFTYVAAFGAFTEVSYATPQESKRALGRLAYLLEGAKSLANIKPIHTRVTFNGKTEEDDFILGMVCSTKSVGGFHAKNVRDMDISLNDGLFEAVFVRDIRNILNLNDAAAKALRLDFTDPQHFLSFQARDVRVEFDAEVPWTLDGEDGGACRVAEIHNLHNAVRIRTPRHD